MTCAVIRSMITGSSQCHERDRKLNPAIIRNASARVHRAGSTPVTVTPAGGFCVPGKEGA